MNNEEDIFEAVAALAVAERPAYLDAACAGQPKLRARIEALLRSHDVSGFMHDGTALSADSPAERTGERIGRYRLLQQIGEGGFGVVWMAEQVEPLTRRVALKIIKAGMDTKEVIARFEAERQALAMMDHPNIARVFDAGATDKGRPFFVMELVKGIPITKFCDEQQFTTRQRLELFVDVCSAINHAHQKGVIHRDIKPSNVMVTLHGDNPVPKVIDFGIAKATEGRLTDRTLFTHFDQFVGTPAYMSPEQTALSGLDVDTRSDIYSLGILLYELLTGKPPFDSKTLLSAGYEEMRRIIREVEPPRPSLRLGTVVGDERTALAKARHIESEKLSRTVEPDLDWIVMKSIEKERTRRYETANGLALDIQRFLANEPVSASPPSAKYRLSKLIRRHKMAFAAGSAVALALLLGIVGTTLGLMRAETNAKAQKKSADEAWRAKVEAQLAAAKAESQVREASRSDFATAGQRLADGKWQEGIAYLGRAIRYDPENRQAQDALLLALLYGARDAGRLPTHEFAYDGSGKPPGFSPDGSCVFLLGADKTAQFRDARTGKLLGTPLSHSGPVEFATFNRSGSRVLTLRRKMSASEIGRSAPSSPNQEAQLWDGTTGQPIGPLIPQDGILKSAAFSPDGARVLTVISRGQVVEGKPEIQKTRDEAQIWDAGTGRLLGTLPLGGVLKSIAFSPDGARVLAIIAKEHGVEDKSETPRTQEVVQIWDAGTGRLHGTLQHDESEIIKRSPPRVDAAGKTTRIRTLQQSNPRIRAVKSSHDGSRILTSGSFGTALVWDGLTCEPIGSPIWHTKSSEDCLFSPDASAVVTFISGKDLQIWSADTGEPMGVPLVHEFSISSAKFSPDGSRLLTISRRDEGTAQIWNAKTGQPVGAPLMHGSLLLSARFSPDGRQVITGGGGGARIWDAGIGQPLSGPLLHDYPVDKAILSPDGTRLLVAASHSKTVGIWDAMSGVRVGAALQHSGPVNSAVFSPDGSRILTGSSDNTARIWDARTGLPMGAPLLHGARVESASFSPDGSRVLTTCGDRIARIWDAGMSQPLGTPLHHAGKVTFSSDGSRMLSVNGDRTVRILNGVTGEQIGAPLRHFGFVWNAGINPDNSRVVTTRNDDTVQIWDANSGNPVGSPLLHRSTKAVSFSADGSRVVTAGLDWNARIWDAGSGRLIGAPLQHDSRVASALFSPDGLRVVTASEDGTARIWDAGSGQAIGVPFKQDESLGIAVLSPDGSRMATGAWDGIARVWDVATGQLIGSSLQHDGKSMVSRVEFSRDGLRVLTTTPTAAQIWEVGTGKPISASLPHDGNDFRASFSAEGLRVITATSESARIWDAVSGQPIGFPLRHDSSITSATFSPDGARVVTTSDRSARIWAADTGQPAGAPLLHDIPGSSASFSHDGSRLVISGFNGIARIWEIPQAVAVLSSHAESLTAFCAGGKLDSNFGTLQPLAAKERLEIWNRLQPTLPPLVRFAAEHTLTHETAIRPASFGSSMTIREAATRVLRSGNAADIGTVLQADPSHPLLPFALAAMETTNQPRAAWLCDFGMERMPRDLSVAQLRLGARILMKIAEKIPAQKSRVLTLLDRARDKEPEDDGTKALRAALDGSEAAGRAAFLERQQEIIQILAERRSGEAVTLARKMVAAQPEFLMKDETDPESWLANALLLHAASEWGRQHPNEAVETVREADEIIERLRSRPTSFSGGELRVDLFSRYGHWRQAALLARRLHEQMPHNNWAAFRLGLLLVKTEENMAHEALCQELLRPLFWISPQGHEGQTGSRDDSTLDLLVTTVCLRTPSDIHLKWVDLIESRMKWRDSDSKQNRSWFLMTRGLIESLFGYRTDTSPLAISQLESTIPTLPPPAQASAYAVRAMTQYHKDPTDDARNTLREGEELLNRNWFSEDRIALEGNPHDWLLADILIREAKSLLGQK